MKARLSELGVVPGITDDGAPANPVGDADPVAIEADDAEVGDLVEKPDGSVGSGRDQRDLPGGAGYKAGVGGLRPFTEVLKSFNALNGLA